MHYTHVVALPGDIDAEKLADELDDAMSRFDENLSVALHRDTSVYAEHRDVALEKARASDVNSFRNWTAGLSDDEILEQWNGTKHWTEDGWPMTTCNPDGQWDYWRVGGRWSFAWVLKPGSKNGPLQAENSWDSPKAPEHGRQITDCARKCDIEPESIAPTYSWLDLDGKWHTRWVGPTHEEATSHRMPGDTSHWERNMEEFGAEFLAFIAALPGDTWLVHIDYHN